MTSFRARTGNNSTKSILQLIPTQSGVHRGIQSIRVHLIGAMNEEIDSLHLSVPNPQDSILRRTP